MPDMIRKIYQAEVRGFDEKTGEVEIFLPLSKNTVDRDEEIVLPSALMKRITTFQERPIMVSSHGYGNLMNQIGEFLSIKITEDGMYGKPKYYINKGNEEADWGFFLASIGMAAYSIGFIPFNYETPKDEKSKAKRIWTDVELLEVSHVIVPSNRDAAQSMRDALATRSLVPKGIMGALDAVIAKPEGTEKQNYHLPHSRPGQAEIKDELDYCLWLIKCGDLNEENVAVIKTIGIEIKRLAGDDIPVKIEEIKETEPKESMKDYLQTEIIRQLTEV